MNKIISHIRKFGLGNGGLRSGSAKGAGQRGFSLIELVIAVALSTVVALAIYSMYSSFFQQQQRQDLTLEAEQNARAGLNMMERELLNAGYLAATLDPITQATPTVIQFRYQDPSDVMTSATAGDLLDVTYTYVAGASMVTRRVVNMTDGGDETVELIPDVKSFNITYYDANGAAFVPVDAASRNLIRYADISVVTQTSKVPVGMANSPTFALTIHLKLRNIDISQSASDATAPDAPAAVSVRDTGLCGRLQVMWTPSTDGDVAGYKIYYGLASGEYTGVISIPKDSMTDGSTYSCSAEGGPCTISPTVSPLDFTPSDGSAVATYYFAVKSYDNSLNYSGYSPEVFGAAGTETLDGSNLSFGGGSNDSTINPRKPGAVTSFIAADGDVDNKVSLSWGAYNTSTYPDVTGFRLYRKPYDEATPFFTYPIDPSYQIGTATVASTTYDDSSGLIGCSTYQYAIAPVNCDLTLVTNAGGELAGASPATTPYYESYDYAETYGDGSGPVVDWPSGSDSSPTDATVPPDPAPFSVRAGYKRVAVSFKQPNDVSIDRTCVYVVPGATPPAPDPDPLLRDAVYCSQLQGAPGGNRLPEYDGVFPTSSLAQGQSFSLWNNSASGAATTTPSLAESGTYSYTAIAYDICGNRSTAATSSATTTLCGEDPGPPDGVATKPPAATNLTISGCGGSPDSFDLTWTPVSSDLSAPSSYTNPYDLAGYRLFSSTTADFSAGTLLNTVAPFWEPPYSDATIVDGGAYYYRVYSSDCPFEKGDDTGGAAPTAGQMMGMLQSVQAGPVYPARLEREMKYPVAWTDHREVLTGVTIDGAGNSTPDADYAHDSVTMFLYNNGSSLSSMTLNGMSLSWVNSSAYLREVWVGGGSSGIGLTQVASLAVGATTSVTGNDPYGAAVNNISFAGVQIPGGGTSRNTPLTFVFTDSSGNPVDMRSDKLLLTLNVTNDSTGTTTCTSHLTVSRSYEGITSPLGPTVGSVVQNQPSSPTFPYLVPGISGLNTVPVDGATYSTNAATGGTSVQISALLNANTSDEVSGGYVPVVSGTVYYAVTDLTTGTAPDWTVAGNYTPVSMIKIFGNSWRGTIPAQDTTAGPKRIWYYVLTIDNDGNFDRWPSTSYGAAVYDQKPFIVCDVTPKAPTSLTQYSLADGNAAFSWPRVTQYTTGAAISTAVDPLYYRVYRKTSIAGAYTKLYDVPDVAGGAWVLIPAAQTVAPATSSYYVCEPLWLPGNCIYWDYIAANTNDLTYYIQSKNSCGVDSNLSSATGTWRECQGAGAPTLDVTPASITVGESLTIKINDCTAASAAIDPVTLVAYNAEINSVDYTGLSTRSGSSLTNTVNESSVSSGYFPTTLTTSMTAVAGSLTVAPTDDLTDTVTISCAGCTPASIAIPVSADACSFNPLAPTSLTGTRVKVGNDCSRVDLSWTASTSPDVVQYNIYRKDSVGGTFSQIAVSGGTTYTDTTVDPGKTGSTCNVGTNYYFIRAVDSCSPTGLLSPVLFLSGAR